MNMRRLLWRSLPVAAATGLLSLGLAGTASASTLYSCSYEGGSGYCTVTKANLNERGEPTSASYSYGVIPKGATAILFCWTTGQSVHGDDVWYQGQPVPPNPEIVGFFLAGYYLDTGHDPAAPIDEC